MKNIFYLLFFISSFCKAQHAPFNPHPKEEVDFYNRVVVYGGSLTPTERMSTSFVVSQLKDTTLWDKMYAVYPMVGRNAAGCKANLMANTYSLTPVNTVAGDFGSAGWTPNGTTSYMKTGLIPSTVMTLNNTAVSYYSQTSGAVAGSDVEVGSTTSATVRKLLLLIRLTGDLMVSDHYTNSTSTGRISVANTTTSGFALASRTDANTLFLMLGAAQIGATQTNSQTGTLPNLEFYLGANNNVGTPSAYTAKICSQVTIGLGLNLSEGKKLQSIFNVANQFLARTY